MPATPDFVRHIALAELAPPSLGRRTHSKASLDELTASVKQSGVLSPICVRAVGDGTFETVYGDRRRLAALAAGFTTIPAVVRDLDDEGVRQEQLVENLQREDVSPIEEAEGYQAMSKIGLTPKDVAARVGKSEAHIHQRLKLLHLPKVAREALATGELAVGVAQAIGRIPDKDLREEAAAAVLEKADAGWDPVAKKNLHRSLTPAEQLSIIHVDFTLRFEACGFALDDAGLVPSAGPCTTCPKRTGNAPLLFPELAQGKDDRCTDPKCFVRKKDAAWARVKRKLEDAGKPVIDDPKVWAENTPDRLSYGEEGQKYVLADQTTYDAGGTRGKTWKQVVGKGVEPIIARDRTGAVREIYPKAVAAKAAKAARGEAKKATKDTPVAKRQREEAKRALAETEARRQADLGSIGLIVQAVETNSVLPDPKKEWALLAELLVAGAELGEVAIRRGLVDRSYLYGEDREALKKTLPGMKPPAVRALVLEIALATGEAHEAAGLEDNPSLRKACALYEVDYAGRRKAALKAAKEPPSKTITGEGCILETGVDKHCADCDETHCEGRRPGTKPTKTKKGKR